MFFVTRNFTLIKILFLLDLSLKEFDNKNQKWLYEQKECRNFLIITHLLQLLIKFKNSSLINLLQYM